MLLESNNTVKPVGVQMTRGCHSNNKKAYVAIQLYNYRGKIGLDKAHRQEQWTRHSKQLQPTETHATYDQSRIASTEPQI